MATLVEIGSDGDRQVHIVKLKTDNSKSEQIIWSYRWVIE